MNVCLGRGYKKLFSEYVLRPFKDFIRFERCLSRDFWVTSGKVLEKVTYFKRFRFIKLYI